jgi:hypothetical protein
MMQTAQEPSIRENDQLLLTWYRVSDAAERIVPIEGVFRVTRMASGLAELEKVAGLSPMLPSTARLVIDGLEYTSPCLALAAGYDGEPESVRLAPHEELQALFPGQL